MSTTPTPTPTPAGKPRPADIPAGVGKAVLPGNPVGWVGLAVAVAVTAIQVAFAYTVPGVETDTVNPARSVLLFLSLIGGVVAAVLGSVALASRRQPRWSGIVAVAIGLNVFLVSVASWVGSLVTGA